MSAIYRAPIFFLTTLKAGWRTALSAFVVEGLFRAATSGVMGAITQAVRNLNPQWLALLIVLAIVPGVVQALELLVHWLRGTPNLKTGLLVSTVITCISCLFNWYAMRQGTLLTGGEGNSFGTDLKRLPMVILRFIAAGPVFLWRAIAGRSDPLSEPES
jgi:hypothetical protein